MTSSTGLEDAFNYLNLDRDEQQNPKTQPVRQDNETCRPGEKIADASESADILTEALKIARRALGNSPADQSQRNAKQREVKELTTTLENIIEVGLRCALALLTAVWKLEEEKRKIQAFQALILRSPRLISAGEIRPPAARLLYRHVCEDSHTTYLEDVGFLSSLFTHSSGISFPGQLDLGNGSLLKSHCKDGDTTPSCYISFTDNPKYMLRMLFRAEHMYAKRAARGRVDIFDYDKMVEMGVQVASTDALATMINFQEKLEYRSPKHWLAVGFVPVECRIASVDVPRFREVANSRGWYAYQGTEQPPIEKGFWMREV